MGFQNPITGGQGALVRDQMKSPNFVAGSTGWAVFRDGSAEFNNITIRGGTSVGSTSLWYNGTPATGNLIFSISGTSGTDPFGNHYASGVVTYAVSLISDVALRNGNLYFGNADTDFTDGGHIFSELTAGGDISIYTGTNASAGILDQVRAAFRAGASSQPTGAAQAPSLSLIDGDLTSSVDVLLSGSLIRTDLSGTAETWQTPSYAANWSAGSAFSGLGGDPLRFRLMGEDDLWIHGLSTTAAGAGTTAFTLPANWRPKAGFTPHGQIAKDNGVISTVEVAVVGSTGAVILGGVPAAGDKYSFNMRIPLRNVG